ncbi:MAG TPA: DNA translocase FtsK [Bacilli bacterium]|nr:DNA translocase FtsK [Bacilli bacterium]
MAKKKKKKDEATKSFQYSVELNGLLLILIGLIGFGTFGPVGRLIKNFAIFLMGSWYVIILLSVLILGIIMIIKRKLPKMYSTRLIGLYFLIIAILMFSHLEYAIANELKGKAILSTTVDNFMGATNSLNSNVGGGIIGALFIVLFTSLLDISGTKIVIVILMIFGLILLFDITIADIFKKIKEIFANMKTKSLEKKEKREKYKEEAADEDEYDYEEDKEYETDDKVVITSAEELKNSAVTATASNEENQNLQVQVNNNYRLPSLDLLDNPKKSGKVNSNDFIRSNKMVLERVLNDFGIKGTVVEIHVGPSVTQYEVSVPHGTKLNKISSINKEIALALAAKDVRLQTPIPGKSTIGVEIPNPVISEVKIKEILANIPKSQANAKILVALGKDIMGRPQATDIAKTPHLLVAGSTGSGKSVCINSFLATILMKYRPDEVKLLLVDPKKVELSNYNGVPHLLCPVVTDPKKASVALQKIVSEMEKRYDLFSEKGVKNIGTYNEWVDKENQKSEVPIKKMPYIVVIIDELADLMLVASKEVEDSIMRITQMARAAGIHLIVATQRPSTDVITGVVKANIPSRISFAVATGIDSRTILDQTGAEKLLGKGDMLFLPMGENDPIRIQGTYISDDEIRRVIEYVSKEQAAVYDNSITQMEDTHLAGANSEKEEYEDPLYNEIVDFAIKTGKVSASLLQRRFRLGYNRAARIVDLLEERGIIGPPNGSKPREVLVKPEEKDS